MNFDKVKALLVSNSVPYNRGYLDHCAHAIKGMVGDSSAPVLFFPYALQDHQSYVRRVRDRFAQIDIKVVSATEVKDIQTALHETSTVFVGGGNTFRLLHGFTSMKWHKAALSILRERVLSGEVRYIGSSAGANLACPTIMTTNDMPIVTPDGFNALGIIPFQINPHYVDPDPRSSHMGETRDARIFEFHEENVQPVVALREGSWLNVEEGMVTLEGTSGAKIFRRGEQPQELVNGQIPPKLLL